MTVLKKNAFIRKIKDISLSTSLIIALSVGVTACSDEDEYEKGIQTFITETEKGNFKIVDEKVVENPADSKVIINYLDGKVDTMNVEQAEKIANQQMRVTQNNTSYSPNNDFSLGTVLLFGGVGYMMGSTLRDYRYQREQSNGGSSMARTYYHSSTTYHNTRSSVSTFTGSSTRSGFFGSSGRGSSGA